MINERIKITKYENNPEWDSLEVKGKWTNWGITSYSNGDVKIKCCSDSNGSEYLILNQDELKQVIEFLQSKVIK